MISNDIMQSSEIDDTLIEDITDFSIQNIDSSLSPVELISYIDNVVLKSNVIEDLVQYLNKKSIDLPDTANCDSVNNSSEDITNLMQKPIESPIPIDSEGFNININAAFYESKSTYKSNFGIHIGSADDLFDFVVANQNLNTDTKDFCKTYSAFEMLATVVDKLTDEDKTVRSSSSQQLSNMYCVICGLECFPNVHECYWESINVMPGPATCEVIKYLNKNIPDFNPATLLAKSDSE